MAAPHRCPGLEIRAEGLAIGLHLADGTIVVHLTGTLDRQGRAALLRVTRRAIRSGTGLVRIDCGGLATHDDAGIDAFVSIARLAGVRSVHLCGVGADLGHRLDEAGLAERLHVRGGPDEDQSNRPGSLSTTSCQIGWNATHPASGKPDWSLL